MPPRDASERHERCTACGFDGAGYAENELLAAMRSLGQRWRTLLGDAGRELRVRPRPHTWSALEYAAHSRDIIALHLFGVEQALTSDEPAFPAIDEGLVDAVAAGYAEADPDVVADELAAHAFRLAQIAADAGPVAWQRGLTIGEERNNVRFMLEHALHDSLHHVDDVERGLVHLREPPT